MKQFVDKIRILRMMLWAEFVSWKVQIWDHDMDDYFCCSGRDCACGGESIRDAYLSE